MPKLTEIQRNCPYHVILTFPCTEFDRELTHFGSICISEQFTSWTICCYTCVLCIFDGRQFMTWNRTIWSGEPHKCVDKWTVYINLVQRQHANFQMAYRGKRMILTQLLYTHTLHCFGCSVIRKTRLSHKKNKYVESILKLFRSFGEYLFRITRTEGNEKWLEQISKCTSATLNAKYKQIAG